MYTRVRYDYSLFIEKDAICYAWDEHESAFVGSNFCHFYVILRRTLRSYNLVKVQC